MKKSFSLSKYQEALEMQIEVDRKQKAQADDKEESAHYRGKIDGLNHALLILQILNSDEDIV